MPSSAWNKRLNSSHLVISYAVFCLKKKNVTNPLSPKYYCLSVVTVDLLFFFRFILFFFFFFFNDGAPTEIYPLPLHAALPIFGRAIFWGRRLPIQPSFSISSNAFHMP